MLPWLTIFQQSSMLCRGQLPGDRLPEEPSSCHGGKWWTCEVRKLAIAQDCAHYYVAKEQECCRKCAVQRKQILGETRHYLRLRRRRFFEMQRPQGGECDVIRSEREILHSRLTVRQNLKACTQWHYRVHGPRWVRRSHLGLLFHERSCSKSHDNSDDMSPSDTHDDSEYDVFTYTAASGNSNELCYARAR